MRFAHLPGLALALLAAPAAGAQGWRTLDIARQLRDTTGVTVRVAYGAGKLGVRAATAPMLYQMQLRYNAERSEPLHAFDSVAHTLRVGLRRHSSRFSSDENEAGDLRVDLTRDVPLDLTMELGAVEADLDFSGLRIGRLKVESDASDARIRFDTLNAVPMMSLDIQVGAASLRAERLGNANTHDVRVKAGVGSVDLDFGGQWAGEIDLAVEVTLGTVTIRVPRDVGVRVEMDKFLASFDREGLTKSGDAWVSGNWESARRKLRIKSETVFGRFRIERGDR